MGTLNVTSLAAEGRVEQIRQLLAVYNLDILALQETFLRSTGPETGRVRTSQGRWYRLYLGPPASLPPARPRGGVGFYVSEDLDVVVLPDNTTSCRVYGLKLRGRRHRQDHLFLASYYGPNETDGVAARTKAVKELATWCRRWQPHGGLLILSDANANTSRAPNPRCNFNLLRRHVLQPFGLRVFDGSANWCGPGPPHTTTAHTHPDLVLACPAVAALMPGGVTVRVEHPVDGTLHLPQTLSLHWRPGTGQPVTPDIVGERWNAAQFPLYALRQRLAQPMERHMAAWQASLHRMDVEEQATSLAAGVQQACREGLGKTRFRVHTKTIWDAELAGAVRRLRGCRRWLNRLRRVGLPDTHAFVEEARIGLATARSAMKRRVRVLRCRRNDRLASRLGRSGEVGRRALWAHVRRYRRHAREMPSVMVDAAGRVVTGAQRMQAVRDFWARIYDPARYTDPAWDEEWYHRVEAEAARPPPPEPPEAVRVPDMPITVQEVTAALDRLSTWKAGGSDGVLPWMLKCAGDPLRVALTSLLNNVWDSGHIPTAWRKATISLLYKKDDPTHPANYRPISLLCLAGKTLTRVLSDRMLAWAERRGLLPDNQGGFRPRRGTVELVAALRMLLSMRVAERKRTYACFVDVRKAYDSVWRSALWCKLRDIGANGRVLRLLRQWYTGTSAHVRWGSHTSRPFATEQGVRQGDTISPLLYSIFINGLVQVLNSRFPDAIRVRGTLVVGFFFADDIVLLATSALQLQMMLDAVAEYARTWRFKFNPGLSKTAVIIFGRHAVPHKQADQEVWRLGDIEVRRVATYEYLGVVQHEDLKWRPHLQHVLRGARLRLHEIYGIGANRHVLRPRESRLLLLCELMPVLEYAAGVWAQAATVPRGTGHRSAPGLHALEAVWARGVRYVAGVHARTSVAPLILDLGLFTLDSRWRFYAVSLLRHIVNTTGRHRQIVTAIYRECRARYDASGCTDTANFCHHLRLACEALGETALWRRAGQDTRNSAGMPVPPPPARAGPEPDDQFWHLLERAPQAERREAKAKRELKQRMALYCAQQCLAEMTSKPHLRARTHVFHGREFRDYWRAPRRARQWAAQLRAGSLPLQATSAANRYRRHHPHGDEQCPVCHMEAETEYHFLLRCPLYADIRRRYHYPLSLQARTRDPDTDTGWANTDALDLSPHDAMMVAEMWTCRRAYLGGTASSFWARWHPRTTSPPEEDAALLLERARRNSQDPELVMAPAKLFLGRAELGMYDTDEESSQGEVDSDSDSDPG